MVVPQGASAEIDLADRMLLNDAVDFMQSASIDDVLAAMVPGLSESQRAAVASHSVLGHAAVLVCAASPDEFIAHVRKLGLSAGTTRSSEVVRERLSRRYGLATESLSVSIVHVHTNDGGAGTVEVFVWSGAPADIADRERVERNESHLALQLGTTDDVLVEGVRALLTGPGGLLPDGGGYNHSEDCTALYFRSAHGNVPIPYRRLELRVHGRIAAPPVAYAPATRLLEQMTGAWTTQAIAVAAEIGLADRLPGPREPGSPVAVGTLADDLAVSPDALARLLRYLASIGLAARVGDSYTLTEQGELLRRDAGSSLRPLALMYGGPFYHSFGALAHSVRTGNDGFESLYGQGHFDYFAEHPDLGELFDAAMAASAPMFEPIPGLIDLAAHRVVVDVGGGVGELLGRILTRAPHLRAVLVDREGVLDRAEQRLTAAGCVDRCEFVPEDFTRCVPPGGDLYMLSRVLHDWDDERCLAILRACAAAIRPGVPLLLVERLLPADSSPSLAVTWDLHMLCNVGGRERTTAEYEKLLGAAGFDLMDINDLPLGGSLLQTRRRSN